MSETLYIYLRNKIIEMDAEDRHLIMSATRITLSRNGYALVWFENNVKIALHRLVMSNHPEVDDKVVHHKDGNKLNNRKSNLLLTTLQENSKGKSKQKRNSRKFKGYTVKKTSYGPSYNAVIGDGYERHWLGTYENELDAAIAYDLAALKYFGKDLAILNLPDRDYSGLTIELWMDQKAIKEKRNGKWAISERAADETIRPVKRLILSVGQMASAIGLSRSRFYQLVDANVFPKPDRTDVGLPFYSLDKQQVCKDVIETGVGVNGEPALFRPRSFQPASDLKTEAPEYGK